MRNLIKLISISLLISLYSCSKAADEINVSTVKESWFSGFTSQMVLTSVFFSLLFFLIILIYFLNPKKLYEQLVPQLLNSQRLQSLISQNNSIPSKISSGNSSAINREIQALQERIDQLEGDIKKQNELINNSLNSRNADKTAPSNESKTPSVKESNKEAIYLPNPNQEGSFNESSALTSYKEGASIYRLTKESATHAEFEIENRESSIKLALQYPDKRIDPVCETENDFELRFTSILTIEKGKAELQNGKWKVIKKARIKYE